MIVIKSFVVLSAVLCVLCNEKLLTAKDSEADLLSKAFKKLLVDVLVPINKTINVITYEGFNYLAIELLHQLMNNYGQSMNFQIGTCREYCRDFNIFKQTTLLILDKWIEPLNEFIHLAAECDVIFMFYISGMTPDQYLDKFGNIRSKSLPNFLLLIDEGDFLQLSMPAFFSATSCTKAYLQNINRFPKAVLKWELETFDLASQLKFHGCPLGIDCFRAEKPELILPKVGGYLNTNFSQYSGYFVDIIKELSRQYNFKVRVILDDSFRHIQLLGTPNKFTADSLFRRPKYLTTINRQIFFIIPLGDYYTGLEKLFLPYDDIGWILIVMTFTAGLIVIQVVVRLSKNSQNFVFGHRVTSPTMNLFVAFFGLGQIVLPGRNFARFILILFILWCLIIRTAYQGILYELLKSDGRKELNLNAEDFLERNATIHTNEFSFYAMMELTGRTSHELNILASTYNASNVHEHVEILKNASGNNILAIDDLQFAISNKMQAFNDVKLLKNENHRIPLRFALVPGYFMQKLFEHKLMQMQEAGLIYYYQRRTIDSKYSDLLEEEDEPKVLSLSHLSIGFQAFLLFCCVAILVFVIEIVKFKIRR